MALSKNYSVLINELKKVNTKTLILYDGNEEGFYNFSVSIMCGSCDKHITLALNDREPFGKLDEKVKDYLLQQIKHIEIRKYSSDASIAPAYKYRNLSLSYSIHCCIKNDKKFLFIIADGESQPQRYTVILLGTFEIIS